MNTAFSSLFSLSLCTFPVTRLDCPISHTYPPPITPLFLKAPISYRASELRSFLSPSSLVFMPFCPHYILSRISSLPHYPPPVVQTPFPITQVLVFPSSPLHLALIINLLPMSPMSHFFSLPINPLLYSPLTHRPISLTPFALDYTSLSS